MARIFISYRESDEDARNQLHSLFSNTNNTLSHIPITDRIDLREESPEERKQQIREYIKSLMRESDLVALLLGKTTHSGPVVKYECELALSQQKGIFAIRIPGTNDGLPKILKDQGVEIVEFEIREIQSVIDQLLP